MAELNKPIKSLDELRKGDVVLSGCIPHIVHAIGDVPEHEMEAVLCPLYRKLPLNLSHYCMKTIVEPLAEGSKISLVNDRNHYTGWKYLAPLVVLGD